MNFKIFVDKHEFNCTGDKFTDKDEYASYMCKAYAGNRPMTFTFPDGGKLLLPFDIVKKSIIIISDEVGK